MQMMRPHSCRCRVRKLVWARAPVSTTHRVSSCCTLFTHHCAVNVHGQSNVVLAPGLIACGLGGAVPGVQNGYIVWEGFPYTEHQVSSLWVDVLLSLFTLRLPVCASCLQTGELLQRVWAARENADAQVLLLTHCGPYDVGTTVSMKPLERNPEPIQSGSTNLR